MQDECICDCPWMLDWELAFSYISEHKYNPNKFCHAFNKLSVMIIICTFMKIKLIDYRFYNCLHVKIKISKYNMTIFEDKAGIGLKRLYLLTFK